MDKITEFKERFNRIKGKTIAIVYIFEGDNEGGFEHFYIWKSSIISKWMNAVEELSCMPFIIDVRTFIDKAINNTLPHIDYVLNLNSGTYDLSSMALVPSMCSAIGIPCIPCNAISILTGESKTLSNHIAASLGIRIPKSLPYTDYSGIFRPNSLGNSLGVKRGLEVRETEGLYQEFIQGFEITTPLVYNAFEKRMDVLPTIAFLPCNRDPQWFYGETDKKQQQGYQFAVVEIDKTIKEKYIELANTLSIQTFCRIDSRVKSDMIPIYKPSERIPVGYNDIFFIEINVMPTIRDNNSFSYSFDSINESDSLYENISLQKEMIKNLNVNSFLLASSMLSYTKK